MIALHSSRKILPQEPTLDLVIISLCLHSRDDTTHFISNSTSASSASPCGDHPWRPPGRLLLTRTHTAHPPSQSWLPLSPELEPLAPQHLGPTSSSLRQEDFLLSFYPLGPSWSGMFSDHLSYSWLLLSPTAFHRSLHSGHLLQYFFIDWFIVWNHPFPNIYVRNRIGKLESISVLIWLWS